MLGKTVRGLRHLWRLSGTLPKKILIKSDRGYDICDVLKTSPNNITLGERMYIFNQHFNHNEYGWDMLRNDKEIASFLKDKEPRRVLELEKNSPYITEFSRILHEIYILPDNFDDMYASFVKENAKLFKNIEQKYGTPQNKITLKLLFIFSEGSKNFVEWGANHIFKGTASMLSIRSILLWNENYGQLAKNLSKGTITAYTSKDSIFVLLDEMNELRKQKRINDTINSFNTQQKKILKGNVLSDSDKKALASFAKLSETKRINFIRKMSTVEDFNELMRQMKHTTSTHFDWSKESFMDYITNVEGIDYEMVFENDSVVLVKVEDYETIKQLAKTTNWCISKNKVYWNNYITHNRGYAKQYILFDFSKAEDHNLSIVGFTTTKNKGITSAHNFINDNLLVTKSVSPLIKSYMARFISKNDIYGIIGDCGIDITLVAEYDKPKYKWNKESLMAYLMECVKPDNVDVFKSDDKDPNKLVISVRDKNLRYFLGESYISNFSCEYWSYQHILFIDFSQSEYSPNRLMYAVIAKSKNSDSCIGLYNSIGQDTQCSFDNKLVEYGIPYDIIRRVKDDVKIAANAFLEMNTKLLRDTIGGNSSLLKTAIKEYWDGDTVYDKIKSSFDEYLSFDYLDIIYDNGFYLSTFMSVDYVADLLSQQFRVIKSFGRTLFQPNETLMTPSEEQIKAFYDEKIENIIENTYIGHYLIIKKILEKERKTDLNYAYMYNKLIFFMSNAEIKGSLPLELVKIMLSVMDVTSYSDAINNVIRYCLLCGDDELKAKAKEMSKISDNHLIAYENVVNQMVYDGQMAISEV